MIDKAGYTITEFIRDDKTLKWNNVKTPNITDLTPLENLKSLNFSSPNAFVQTYVEAVDKQNYMVMSQTEITDFFYRFSNYTIENVSQIPNVVSAFYN